MSYFDGAILTQRELPEPPAGDYRKLPSNLQIGETCQVALPMAKDRRSEAHYCLEGRVVGVRFEEGMVSYDVAFPIGTTGLFAVTRNLRGNIQRVGQQPAPGDGLVDTSAVKLSYEVYSRNYVTVPHLSLVKGED